MNKTGNDIDTSKRPADFDADFQAAVDAVRNSGILGNKGRLLALFEYLAQRTLERHSPTENELAAGVFGRTDFTDGNDDAMVRVSVHRLRKKLEELYAKDPSAHALRLTIPRGEYRLAIQQENRTAEASEPLARPRFDRRSAIVTGVAALLLLNLVALFVFHDSRNNTASEQTIHATNPLWQKFQSSSRPIVIVVGDYFMFREIDRRHGTERLIRDFNINSAADLQRAQQNSPEAFANATFGGLQYLPFSVSYALKNILSQVQRQGRPISLMAASKASAEILKDNNVIYVGLLSGLAFLEEPVFATSHYAMEMTYDEIIDIETGVTYKSGEKSNLPIAGIYVDYGYLAVLESTDKKLIAVVAGTDDTGLLGVADIASQPMLPAALQNMAGQSSGYEALLEIRGQDRANISTKVLSVHTRPPSTVGTITLER